MESVVLASSSPRRREWLSSRLSVMEIGLKFYSIAEAEPGPIYGMEVGRQTEEICLQKAKNAILEHGLTNLEDRTIVVADTLIEDPDDEMLPLGKPIGPIEAAAMLMRLSGSRHRVWSSTAIARPKEGILDKKMQNGMKTIEGWGVGIWTDYSIVEFADIGEAGVARLVKGGSWIGKAGGYDLAGEASEFLTLVEGEEVTVLGFSPKAIQCLVEMFG